jgi:hypothetical protein
LITRSIYDYRLASVVKSMRRKPPVTVKLQEPRELSLSGLVVIYKEAGKKITRRNWDVIPMPALLISRVNYLGKDQPEMFTFTDRHGGLIGHADVQDVPDEFANADGVEIAGVDR